MRIFAAADLHARPGRIDNVCHCVASHFPDVLVIAGDISNYRNPHSVLGRLNDLGIPVLLIRGNSDLMWHEKCYKRYSNIYSPHMETLQLGGVSFAGISGAIPVPFRSRIKFFEKEIIHKGAAFISGDTILVVHPPPFGTLDHVMGRWCAGSKTVAKLVTLYRPRVVICGHIHEDTGVGYIGKTVVVNCSIAHGGCGAIIDIETVPGADGDNIPVVSMV